MPTAPATPWSSRAADQRPDVGRRRAQRARRAVNPARPASSGRRRPSASLAGPASSWPAARPNRQAVSVSWASEADAPMSRLSSGRPGGRCPSTPARRPRARRGSATIRDERTGLRRRLARHGRAPYAPRPDPTRGRKPARGILDRGIMPSVRAPTRFGVARYQSGRSCVLAARSVGGPPHTWQPSVRRTSPPPSGAPTGARSAPPTSPQPVEQPVRRQRLLARRAAPAPAASDVFTAPPAHARQGRGHRPVARRRRRGGHEGLGAREGRHPLHALVPAAHRPRRPRSTTRSSTRRARAPRWPSSPARS